MSIVHEIRDRQKALKVNDTDVAIVVGVGGIGSWVALNLGLSGCVKNLVLIDPDTVESSNLNRTPFRLCDIGAFKVDALQYLILERRPINMTCYREKTNEEMAKMLREMHLNNAEEDKYIIFDCRDEVFTDLYELPAKYYKVGYDGLDITIDGDPKNTPVWGEATGYRVIPSFICPAQLAGNLVVMDALCQPIGKVDEDYPEDSIEEGRLESVVSFSCTDLLKHIVKLFS